MLTHLNLFKVYGGYRSVDHLFPFRTEKLSTLAPMVLGFRESRSPPFFRPNLVLLGWVFLCAKVWL
uniref:Uncharacterized protein n=1 Tax=uncultured Sphingobacterium sp. EB080_L08E11 TaxID=710992 RepID=E0Y0T6_9SPHI|nr:hypothetical protein [uncultured Sphingobacterium sp. EB080_L08E11]